MFVVASRNTRTFNCRSHAIAIVELELTRLLRSLIARPTAPPDEDAVPIT